MSSWFYAGPEGNALGPITLEELKHKRAEGVIAPNTYVLEHTDQSVAAWRYYHDLFPDPVQELPPPPPPAPAPAPSYPPIPPAGSALPQAAPFRTFPRGTGLPTAAVDPKAEPAQESLFPSEVALPVYSTPAFSGASLDKETNSCALFGFLSSLVSLFTLMVCVGLIVSPFSLILSILGLMQLRRPATVQTGRGLAWAGVVISLFVMIMGLVIMIFVLPSFSTHQGPISAMDDDS